MIIGIDPDVDKSGVAIKTKEGIVLKSMPFFDLLDFLLAEKDNITNVMLEWCWHNKKGNYYGGNERVSANIGKGVGRNHQVGRLIEIWCKRHTIPYTLRKPLKKIWKKGKISHEELMCITKLGLKRTNQEVRDACLLIL